MSLCDTKQSESEDLVMLELWGMRSTSSLPSLPGSLWPGGVASDKVLFMGKIKLKWIVLKLTVLTFNYV